MNFIIFLYLLAVSPKLLLERLRGKKHPNLLQRIGFSIPKLHQPIWVHAVSVGEVKAAVPLIAKLRERYHCPILLTTTTATGQEEARRSLQIEALAYLPIDLSWIVRKWVKKLNPKLFILIETDIWPNLIKALKRNGSKVLLVSGKMSQRSAKRFHFFKSVSRKIFSHFDKIALQDTSYLPAFYPLTEPHQLHIAGNLKWDISAQPTEPLFFPKPALIISCTHPGEEELILNELQDCPYFLILAPRHPERFAEVKSLLHRKKIPFTSWEHRANIQTNLLFVDVMGKLSSCYAASSLAILGGSYIPDIGGHNLLEPLLYQTPVLFGPYAYAQQEICRKVVESGAGKLVNLSDLRTFIESFSEVEEAMKIGIEKLQKNTEGAVEKTMQIIHLCINQEAC